MKSLEQLKMIAEAEGFDPDGEHFEKRIRQLKVIQCREHRNVRVCSNCDLYFSCELIEAVMKDKADAAAKKAKDKESNK
jgi:hypothetical protein